MTTTNNKLDNDTVRRLSKLISGSKSNTNSTPIMTGKVVQNDNSLYVAVDDDTLVPISDTSATVNVGDVVTIALTDETGLIVGNNTDKSVATTNLTKTANGLKLDIEGKASKAELTLESDKLQSSITDTKKDLNNTITQTAEGLTVKITNAQDTADAAKTSADDARKVATNYLSFNSSDGLVVGDMTASTLKNNTQITSSGVNIRNGSNVLASFEDDEIALGKNSPTSSISMCNGKLNIKYRQPTTTLSYAEIYCSDGLYIGGPYYDCPCISLFKDDGVSHVSINLAGQGTGLYYVGSSSSDAIFTIDDRLIRGEELLYSSDTGTTSTVTLSESAANFTYLEIYYKNTGANGANTKSVKIYSPDGKVVNLTDFYKANTTPVWQLLTSACTINGTSITRENAVYVNADQSTKKVSTGTNTNTGFAITRVVGIK